MVREYSLHDFNNLSFVKMWFMAQNMVSFGTYYIVFPSVTLICITSDTMPWLKCPGVWCSNHCPLLPLPCSSNRSFSRKPLGLCGYQNSFEKLDNWDGSLPKNSYLLLLVEFFFKITMSNLWLNFRGKRGKMCKVYGYTL